MSEELEGAEAAGAEPQSAGIGADPVAMALALGGASRAKADKFLDQQTRLAKLQGEHLHEQRDVVLSRLKIGRFNEWLKAALQVLVVLAGVALVGALGVMAWNAHDDHGLVIDAFSVPPNLAADGLTGQVVASRFLDKLQAMQTETKSDRPASSFQNNWGSDIKLEVPETGLTFGELDRLLREKLGHASHITGEVFRTSAGIALTARLGDDPPQTFAGPQDKLDDLTQRAAEAVYRANQPYRFSQYLDQHGRSDEALAVISDLAVNGPVSERGWAYAEWSNLDLERGDAQAARTHGLAALAVGGGSLVESEIAVVGAEVWSGHDEKALYYSIDLERRSQTRAPEQTKDYFDSNRLVATGWLRGSVGDLLGSIQSWRAAEKTVEYYGSQKLSPSLAAMAFAMDHDLPGARAALAEGSPLTEADLLRADALAAFSALPDYWMAAEAQHWTAALAAARGADAWLAANRAALPVYELMRRVWIHPLEALAVAQSGDTAAAGAMIAATPLDCYLCLRMRGQIAAKAGDNAAADRWFAEAVRQGPSVVFAYADWGTALLERGRPDAAIAQFTIANRKGPRFADPLEGWGEALMEKNQSHLALAKFAEANKYAPNWGRLHLKWAEALYYAGKKDEARAQFARAAALDLTPSERSELARQK